MFYSVAQVLLVYISYASMVDGTESHKWDAGLSIYTPLQQLLGLLICSWVNMYTGLIPVSLYNRYRIFYCDFLDIFGAYTFRKVPG